MSDYIKPTIYNKRGLENAWIGIVFSTHDQICGCNEAINHLNHLINQQKWPTSTTEKTTGDETTGTTEIKDAGFDEGDLERLFEASDDPDG